MKKANKIFKKHFWKFLIIDLAFIIILSAFILYARGKIKTYFAVIGQYTEQISALQVALQQESVKGLMNLQALLTAVEPLVDKLAFFTLFVVPLVILLLWSISQAMNYSLINKGKWFKLKQFLYLFFYTIPFFLMILWIGNKLLNLFYIRLISIILTWQFYVYFMLLALLLYLTQVIYSYLFEKPSFKMVKGVFKTAVKKFHKLIHLFFLMLMAWSLITVLMMSAFLEYSSGDYLRLISYMIPLALFLLALGWLRIKFTLKAQDP